MDHFASNLKYLRAKADKSQAQVADTLELGRTQWSNYESGTSYPKFLDLMKIANHFGVSETVLIHSDLSKGEGDEDRVAAEPSVKYLNSFRLRTDRPLDNQSIPLYNLEATAGLVALFRDQNDIDPIDSIRIPNLPKCDGAVFVAGDSMYPLLKSGDIVMYKKVTDILNDIFWGQMYLISLASNGDEYVMVKYIQKSPKGEDYVTLVSENRHHQDKDVLITKIRALALIKGSVRINTMS